jgi:hypothetical protein
VEESCLFSEMLSPPLDGIQLREQHTTVISEVGDDATTIDQVVTVHRTVVLGRGILAPQLTTARQPGEPRFGVGLTHQIGELGQPPQHIPLICR